MLDPLALVTNQTYGVDFFVYGKSTEVWMWLMKWIYLYGQVLQWYCIWYCPPGKPCALTVVCTQGVGSLNLTYLSSRIQDSVISINVQVFKGIKFTFVSKRLRRKILQGLAFKAWSMSKKSQSLMLPIKKIGHQIQHISRAFEHNSGLRRWEFEQKEDAEASN